MQFRVTRDRDGPNHYVNLRCVAEIAKQVSDYLSDLGCHDHELPAGGEWTHCLRFDGPYRRDLCNLLELLQSVLCVPFCSNLDLVLALDFYSVPPADESADWKKTDVGNLISRAKYWKSDPSEPQTSGRQLADQLEAAIQRHGRMTSADAIVAVPGSTPNSFGEKLAKAVASRLDIHLVEAEVSVSGPVRPAKEGHAPDECRTYSVSQDLSDMTVVIVDDVYRSGNTMCGVAEACRDSGAAAVFGIVGARTHRT